MKDIKNDGRLADGSKNGCNVNLYVDGDLFQALHQIHLEFGVKKSDTLLAFIKMNFTCKEDLLVSVMTDVERDLENKLDSLRKARQEIITS
jgi:hypothetical protein|tara:strand:+ start:134 stop:406 length:273 start_codon:yes stop_codon:yes gene_type:complete